MRWPRLIVTLLAMALVLSTPALAQVNGMQPPARSQYGGVGTESVEDIPGSFAGPAAHGTGSLNEALKEPASAGNKAPDSEAAKASSSSKADTVAWITVLPETGSSLPLAPCAGALLVVSGLLVYRSVRR